ncbi:sugar transferase [Sphingobium bisphenolivorans]|uniref:sugar transferase n=1 Tax=Sphingobium bisphenolivorans TaxID=1335760 RepID=UPI00039B6649|nr:sugar transferase [Sphingobium bisphenolivorans]
MSRIDVAVPEEIGLPGPPSVMSRNIRLSLCLILLLADLLALLIGSRLGGGVNLGGGSWAENSASLAAGMFLFVFITFQNKGYTRHCLSSAYISCRNGARGIATTLLMFSLVFFALNVARTLSPSSFFSVLFCTAGLLLLQRFLIARLIAQYLGDQLLAELVIVDQVVLPNEPGRAAVVRAEAAGLQPDLDDPFMLHRLGMLLCDYDRVVIHCPEERKTAWSDVLKGSSILGEIIVPKIEGLAPLAIGEWRGASTLIVSRGPLNLADRAAKRMLDIALAVLVLIAITPLLLLIAAAIKIESPGPILFRQQRVGRGNRMFTILKFRSMRCDMADEAGIRSACRDDDRVTRVGRLIRRTSMDELPQFINVLLGEMSLVGPRPHALGSKAEDALFWQVDRQYWHRHALKPGITGLAQIRGLRGATESKRDVMERVKADLEYMEGWTLAKDVMILFRTFGVLLHDRAF